MKSLKNFDFYRKVPVDLTEPTLPGAVISIVCGLVMILLLLSELRLFLQYEEKSEMFIQQEEGGLLRLNFNITFPRMPCAAFSLDVLDIMGRHEVGVSSTLLKTRLSSNGDPIGEFHGITDGMGSEGCNVVGYVDVNKVPGSFHISAHGLQHFVHMQLGGKLDVNHVIHYFWAGDQHFDPRLFPGSLRPLDDTNRLTGKWSSTFEYFFDIIPTIYSTPSFQDFKAYQMTVHSRDFDSQHQMPAVYFRYQLSPVTVKFTRKRKSFLHFMTYICAIIGGVFTVAGLLNGILHSTVSAFQKNVLGKGS